MALVVATDFQYRVRDGGLALSGSADLKVLGELFVYALVGAYAFSRLRLRRAGRPRWPAVVLWVWIAMVWLSVLHSPVPTYAMVRAAQLTTVGVLALAIARCATREDLHRMAHALMGVGLVGVAIGVAMPTEYPSDLQAGRFTWLQLHPNQAAFILVVGAIIAAAYSLDDRLAPYRHPSRGLYVAPAVVLTGALVATGSRTSVAGLIVAGSAVAYLARPPGRRGAVVMVGAPVVALAILLSGAMLESFAERGQDAETLSELNGRAVLWSTATEAIADSPLLGHGFQAARKIFDADEFSGVGGTHNAYLEVFLDSGALGGVSWILLLAAVVGGAIGLCRLAGRQRRRWHESGPASDGPLLVGLVTMLVIRTVSSHDVSSPATTACLLVILIMAWVLVAREDTTAC